MCKKVISMLIAVVMFVFCCPISDIVGASSILDEVRETYRTCIESDEVITTTEFEGNTISCKYVKSTQEYLLYLNDLEYKLDVSIEENNIMVDIVNEDEENSDNVYGQNPALLVVPFIPELVSVIETCVIATASTVIAAEVTYISTELIDTVLVANSATLVKVDTASVDAAVSTMASGVSAKTEYDESYFEAAIQPDNTIYIGRLLTYKEALIRLRGGYDVLAENAVKSKFLAEIASPINYAVPHKEHQGHGDRLKHYHPIGIAWYMNKDHCPHVWYMYD